MSQIREVPILAEFCDPLPRLIDAEDEDVSRSVSRLGDLLGTRTEPLSVGLRLTGDSERYVSLKVGPQGSEISDAAADEQPDLEFITAADVWRAVARGELSLMDAMAGGNLRFRGDLVLAARVVRQLRQACKEN